MNASRHARMHSGSVSTAQDHIINDYEAKAQRSFREGCRSTDVKSIRELVGECPRHRLSVVVQAAQCG